MLLHASWNRGLVAGNPTVPTPLAIIQWTPWGHFTRLRTMLATTDTQWDSLHSRSKLYASFSYVYKPEHPMGWDLKEDSKRWYAKHRIVDQVPKSWHIRPMWSKIYQKPMEILYVLICVSMHRTDITKSILNGQWQIFTRSYSKALKHIYEHKTENMKMTPPL